MSHYFLTHDLFARPTLVALATAVLALAGCAALVLLGPTAVTTPWL